MPVVHRFLAQGTEALALETPRRHSGLPAGEKRLQPVVGGAREHHPAQNLAMFVWRQRRADGSTPKNASRRSRFPRLRRQATTRRRPVSRHRTPKVQGPAGSAAAAAPADRLRKLLQRLQDKPPPHRRLERQTPCWRANGKRSVRKAPKRRARFIAAGAVEVPSPDPTGPGFGSVVRSVVRRTGFGVVASLALTWRTKASIWSAGLAPDCPGNLVAAFEDGHRGDDTTG